MPRVAGQIDRAKTMAILDAASEVLFERGLGASMDEIARRAGVSKQTIYNHYGSKTELIRALVERRSQGITASLELPGAEEHPEQALAAYARALLEIIRWNRGLALIRLVIETVPTAPELAREFYEGGPALSRARLAAFLERETRAGRLATPDPGEAAEFFTGMVVANRQVLCLMGAPMDLDEVRIERIATEAASRFMRAYGV